MLKITEEIEKEFYELYGFLGKIENLKYSGQYYEKITFEGLLNDYTYLFEVREIEDGLEYSYLNLSDISNKVTLISKRTNLIRQTEKELKLLTKEELKERILTILELKKENLKELTNEEAHELVESLNNYKIALKLNEFISYDCGRIQWIDTEGLGFGWLHKWNESLSEEENIIENEKKIRNSVKREIENKEADYSYIYKEEKENGDISLYYISIAKDEEFSLCLEHSVMSVTFTNKSWSEIKESKEYLY